MSAPSACPFCEIARGDERQHVGRGPGWVAFLDRSPVFFGHVLVVPDQHSETLLDLPAEDLAPLFAGVQQVARAVVVALGCGGTFVAMNNKVSQSVAHLHVHVVPRTKGDGLRGFFWPRKKYASAEEMERMRAQISAALGRAH